MNYEIIKVANGFVVRPSINYSMGEAMPNSAMHVFQTWGAASRWLAEQFKKP